MTPSHLILKKSGAIQPVDNITALVRIHGKFAHQSFVSWVTERANRLGLASRLSFQNDQLIEITVAGHEILVDAFALTCTLGPLSATVDDVETILIN